MLIATFLHTLVVPVQPENENSRNHHSAKVERERFPFSHPPLFTVITSRRTYVCPRYLYYICDIQIICAYFVSRERS